jgi:hypothetical protein
MAVVVGSGLGDGDCTDALSGINDIMCGIVFPGSDTDENPVVKRKRGIH